MATMPVFQAALSLIAVSAVTAGLPPLITAARADPPTAMAPPIPMSAPQSVGVNAGADSVFGWQEVPANQQVPLTRAAFDQGGYQLYDTAGETIIVPFTGQNLYVMKFARSTTGTMYFLNDGSHPVLYVPRHAYLENATVAGARWLSLRQRLPPGPAGLPGDRPELGGVHRDGLVPVHELLRRLLVPDVPAPRGSLRAVSRAVLPDRGPPLLRLERLSPLLPGALGLHPHRLFPPRLLPVVRPTAGHATFVRRSDSSRQRPARFHGYAGRRRAPREWWTSGQQ